MSTQVFHVGKGSKRAAGWKVFGIYQQRDQRGTEQIHLKGKGVIILILVTQQQQNLPIYTITVGANNHHETWEKSWKDVKLQTKVQEDI